MKALDGYYQKGSVLDGPSAMTADACHASCLGDVACNAASFSKSAGTCTTHMLFEERSKNADYTYYAKTCPGEAGATSKSWYIVVLLSVNLLQNNHNVNTP